jgi:hypothetical protein
MTTALSRADGVGAEGAPIRIFDRDRRPSMLAAAVAGRRMGSVVRALLLRRINTWDWLNALANSARDGAAR